MYPIQPIGPATRIPTDALEAERPERSIALCLSGGGYRAMLFHLGALWRLQEIGYLNATAGAPRAADLGPLARISSVSGGSITAGLLALKWNECRTDHPDGAVRVSAFVKEIVEPIRRLAHTNIAGYGLIGVLRLIGAVVMPGSVNEYVTRQYRKHLFGNARLSEIVSLPRFVINAANLQIGCALALHEELHVGLACWEDSRYEQDLFGAGGLRLICVPAAAFARTIEVRGGRLRARHRRTRGVQP